MKLIDDFEHFWKFWSVRFGVLATACTTSLGAYSAGKALDPSFTAALPDWVPSALIAGAAIFSGAAVIARGVDQPKLRPDDTDKAGA